MAALDPENSLRILRLLSRLQARHRFALVLTIHDPGPAPEFFQRVFVVRDGRVVERDTGVLDNWHEIFAADLSEEEDVPPGGQDRALARRPGLFQRLATPATVAAVIGAIVWSGASLDLKGASLANAGSGFLDLVRRMVPGSLAEAAALPWATLAAALAQTVQMALVGTALGAVASLPLALMASGATAPLWLRAPMRLALNAVRTVPSVFWALIFVAVTGLGPLAGVLALAAYSCGYLTKFFYESLEDADGRPAAALRQLGASRLQAFRRGVWPASKPSLLASTFFVFEYNIRAASILGVVGAGGIGADLMYYIEWRQFPSAAAGLLLILAVVVALDAVSRLLRARLGEARGR
jgi:phosphonate transport system permease protein